jgi:hypothetical protein
MPLESRVSVNAALFFSLKAIPLCPSTNLAAFCVFPHVRFSPGFLSGQIAEILHREYIWIEPERFILGVPLLSDVTL